MYAQPEPAKRPPVTSLYDLKHTVAQRWFGHDGSLKGTTVVTSAEIPYLCGIVDASGPDSDRAEAARELIGLIRASGSVTVWIGEAAEAPHGVDESQLTDGAGLG
jgi:hypothetical protein